MPSTISPAIGPISASSHAAAVTAGVPIRIPEPTIGGFGSYGIVFLFTVMRTSPRAASASLPVTPSGRTSTSIRWLSVPPETMRGAALGQARGQGPGVGDGLLHVALELRRTSPA